MKQEKNKALQIIIDAAQNYEKYLNNRHFLIVFQKGRTVECVQIGFRSMHFLHLTGVKTKLPAQRFYRVCLGRKLSVKDIELDQDGKVQQKLRVLPYLHELLYHHCFIGDFINNGVVIQSDYFVGDTKAILSVGFRYGKNIDIPVTLYREDVRKMIRPVSKVLGIFSKQYTEEGYSECTYLSNGHNINEFVLPDNIVINVSYNENIEKKEVDK